MAFQIDIPPPRFGEFDLGGVLYHANYFHILEQIREAFLANGPMNYPSLVQNNSHLALVESRQKFLKPIHYGDSLKAELTFSEVKSVYAVAEYRLFTDQTLHLAQTKLVYVHLKDGAFSVSSIPDTLRGYFMQYEGTTQFK